MSGLALTAEQIAFVTGGDGGISITVSARDARRVPSLMKALGCRVAADGKRISLLLEAHAARQLLADVVATRQVAAVFSLPRTHRTLQLKGDEAVVGELQTGDRELIVHHAEAFAASLVPLGYRREFALAVHGVMPGAELCALTFTVRDAFAQTPGPGAGVRLPRPEGSA
ncbi:MAG: hypothetical protein ACOY33_02580 [Pseudomonadota bacterium]